MEEQISMMVAEWKETPGGWTCEAIGEDGEIYQAFFYGPRAKERAFEYAALKSDNARLQARVSELEAAAETATILIGGRNDAAHPAIKEANINEAWHVLNRLRLPSTPPVGDR